MVSEGVFRDTGRQTETLRGNIAAAKAVASLIRTSLGPKGLDKMIQNEKGEVLVSNDGATILERTPLLHPCAKMMAELSKAQDINAGDGTTSVVVLAGAFLTAAERLLGLGIHPTTISEAFLRGAKQATKILLEMSEEISLDETQVLSRVGITALSSKIVVGYSDHIAQIAIKAIRRLLETAGEPRKIDLKNLSILKKKGGTIPDSFFFEGVLLAQNVVSAMGGPTRIQDARVGLIQFQLSPPKTDIDNQIVISDYQQMDRVLREERKYLLDLCKKIKKTGCNALLLQKSILREALSDLAAHYLAKLGILVIKDVEREDMGRLAQALGCSPVASIDSFSAERLGGAKLIEQFDEDGTKYVKIHETKGRAASILCRGTNKTIVDEVERSLHDVLCVLRSLAIENRIVAGGGAAEIELALRMAEEAKKEGGSGAECLREYAASFESIPFALAENCGLAPVETIATLRKAHHKGLKTHGIKLKTKEVSEMSEAKILQPVFVSTSAVELATETIALILKIDDWVFTR